MATPKFYGKVDAGILHIDRAEEFKQYLKKFEGKQTYIVVDEQKKNRSNNQNNWYWAGVLGTISADTGHTPEELHEIFKRQYLKPIIVKFREREFRMPGSTSNLTTQEFSEYIDKIILEAGIMGITIPAPEEYYDKNKE